MLAAIIFTSCSSNVDPCEEISEEETETLFTNLSTSAQNFSINPTTENCNAYKSNVLEYLDYLNEVKDCVDSTERAKIEEGINEYKTIIDGFNCN